MATVKTAPADIIIAFRTEQIAQQPEYAFFIISEVNNNKTLKKKK